MTISPALFSCANSSMPSSSIARRTRHGPWRARRAPLPPSRAAAPRARRGRRGPSRCSNISSLANRPSSLGPLLSEPGAVADVAVAECLGAIDQVAAIALALLGRVGRRVVGQRPGLALRVPVVLAAAEDHVGLGALQELPGDLALLRAVGDVRGIRCGRGVGDLRRRDEARRLPARRASSSTVRTGLPAASTPMAPLNVFTPVENAVAAAAESVTACLGSPVPSGPRPCARGRFICRSWPALYRRSPAGSGRAGRCPSRRPEGRSRCAPSRGRLASAPRRSRSVTATSAAVAVIAAASVALLRTLI